MSQAATLAENSGPPLHGRAVRPPIIHPGTAQAGVGLGMRSSLSKLRRGGLIEAMSWQVVAGESFFPFPNTSSFAVTVPCILEPRHCSHALHFEKPSPPQVQAFASARMAPLTTMPLTMLRRGATLSCAPARYATFATSARLRLERRARESSSCSPPGSH